MNNNEAMYQKIKELSLNKPHFYTRFMVIAYRDDKNLTDTMNFDRFEDVIKCLNKLRASHIDWEHNTYDFELDGNVPYPVNQVGFVISGYKGKTLVTHTLDDAWSSKNARETYIDELETMGLDIKFELLYENDTKPDRKLFDEIKTKHETKVVKLQNEYS
jgi:hypothetical protein